MRFKREGTVISVDLHGVYLSDAENILLNWLDHAQPGITELRVIHGSNRGTVIRDYVRNELSHPKIKAKLPTLNPGETRILL